VYKLNNWTGRDDFRIKAELLHKELSEMQEKVCCPPLLFIQKSCTTFVLLCICGGWLSSHFMPFVCLKRFQFIGSLCRPFICKNRSIQLIYNGCIFTNCVSTGGNAIASICPVCFHSNFLTEWHLTLTFCMCMDHDHSCPGLKVKVKF